MKPNSISAGLPRRFPFSGITFVAGLMLSVLPVQGTVRLPALLSDGMVLQRDEPVRIWGTASPTEKVSVAFRGHTVESIATASGGWQVFLPAMEAGGPDELVVRGENQLTVHNVLTGEVWLASGQSNMRWTVAQSDNGAEEVTAADYPSIHYFQVPLKTSASPQSDVAGAWRVVSPKTAGILSGVGYFFSRELHKKLRVPVGIIQSTYGNTPAQAWVRPEVLAADPLLAVYFERWEKVLDAYPAAARRHDEEMTAWKAAAARAKDAHEPIPVAPPPPPGPGYYTAPCGLYNAMIAPLTPLTIRGIIWYQGESSSAAEDAPLYQRLFSSLITDWRRQWGLGDIPFIFAQISIDRGKSLFPEVREAQRETLQLRNTAMVVTIDVGEPLGSHPTNKKTVGERFAQSALALAYGEKIEYSGPLFRRVTTEGQQLRLWFDHTGQGLSVRGNGSLEGFWLAGTDHAFHQAKAVIDAGSVVLSCDEVRAPVAARYAWINDARPANLVNRDGFPASPFRTDDWAIVALPAKAP